MALDKELTDSFKVEMRQLIQELLRVVEQINAADAGSFPSEKLAEFAQKIDRIMGTTKMFSQMAPENAAFEKIAKLTALCKAIGYRASEKKDPKLIRPIVVIWNDVLKVVGTLGENLEDPNQVGQATRMLGSALRDRLKWLSEQLGIDLQKL